MAALAHRSTATKKHKGFCTENDFSYYAKGEVTVALRAAAMSVCLDRSGYSGVMPGPQAITHINDITPAGEAGA